MMEIIDQIKHSFSKNFGCAPVHIARAPGRVNLLGEHVDYNDGFVMPVAIDRNTCVAFGPAHSNQTSLISCDYGEQAVFSSDTLPSKTQTDGLPLPGWARYPAGVAWALNEHGLAAQHINAVFASDVPRGAGLSSSASLEIAFAVAWQALAEWTLPPMQLALIGQQAENEYVGVNCGIMDQFASACGEKNSLLYLDCRSLTYQSLSLPTDVVIVVADTKVRHELTEGAYNRRRAACGEAVRLLQQDLPGLRSLRDIQIADFENLAPGLPDEVRKRARHVVHEIERTKKAIHLLETGQLADFGALLNDCHASLRDDYEVSCSELDLMVSIAQALPGCYGARLTGAGFGGCTVNLVGREQVGKFIEALGRDYELGTGLHPEVYVCEPSQGAGLI